MKTAKKKEFLRTLPTGKIFTPSEISAVCAECHLAAPVDFLIAKGVECNWLTSQGNSFQSAKSFAVNYNGVYCWEQKTKRENNVQLKKYFPSDGDLFCTPYLIAQRTGQTNGR